mmetsp:Transcript_31012/g.84852  ORF Transcript_31012/g.84852 Transcript_31012/m.84852 type:complete len:324 (+) Transcript_31012:52-1023(+)
MCAAKRLAQDRSASTRTDNRLPESVRAHAGKNFPLRGASQPSASFPAHPSRTQRAPPQSNRAKHARARACGCRVLHTACMVWACRQCTRSPRVRLLSAPRVVGAPRMGPARLPWWAPCVHVAVSRERVAFAWGRASPPCACPRRRSAHCSAKMTASAVTNSSRSISPVLSSSSLETIARISLSSRPVCMSSNASFSSSTVSEPDLSLSSISKISPATSFGSSSSSSSSIRSANSPNETEPSPLKSSSAMSCSTCASSRLMPSEFISGINSLTSSESLLSLQHAPRAQGQPRRGRASTPQGRSVASGARPCSLARHEAAWAPRR